jgi:hypothetical protein
VGAGRERAASHCKGPPLDQTVVANESVRDDRRGFALLLALAAFGRVLGRVIAHLPAFGWNVTVAHASSSRA